METVEDLSESQARRVARLLGLVVEQSGRSRRSIEAELGLGSSGLSKILNGKVRLQMSHVLSILQAVEVDPGEFFQVAYPRRRAPRKGGLIKEVRLLMKETEPEAGETDDLEDFDERVRLVMLRLLGGGPQRAN